MKLIIEEKKEGTVLPRVMRAAVRLFVEKGVNATTIKDIARESRVSEGALYRHFKGKDELAYRIFEVQVKEFTRELSAAVAAGKTTAEKIQAYTQLCFNSFEQEKDLFTYLILSEHREFNKFAMNFRHPGDVAIDLMAQGMVKGDLRKMDPVVAASMLLGSLIRLCVARARGAIDHDLRQEIKIVSESLCRALLK